ncbi:OLC1v1030046C1 [Oldenlandia corymbosa var. corymbosa]|uniref:OLC1v1030046C1 n=1 Tax=Oldenlandia corymbosa var. corymbosa TaxID=529605 RepID=A0AAV1CF23_OLDCO|nr:OLC1v1030046C1 [Oldenlandia corymbosa var. corymbosa]
MSMPSKTLFWLLFMISFVSLLSEPCCYAASDKDMIIEVCKNTTYPDFCIGTLRSDPRSVGADKKGLVQIITDKALTKGKENFALVKKLLGRATDQKDKGPLTICFQRYDLVVNRNVIDVINELNKNNFFSASIMSSASVDDIQDCVDALAGAGLKSPLTSQNKYVQDLCNLSVDILFTLIPK